MDSPSLQLIEEMTRDAGALQQDVLAQILAQNAETEYLKGFGLNGATDKEMFKSKIPMVTYEDIQPLIRRLADGDRSPILCAQPVSEFILSTGTSGGEGKLIPITKEEWDRRLVLYSLQRPVINKYVKGIDKSKTLYFLFIKSDKKTKGGIFARSVLTSIFRNHALQSQLYDSGNVFTSPIEAIHCVDPFQSMYTQMLCGLYEREQVLRLASSFASVFIRAIRFLQLNWQQLTHDIRIGSLNPKVTDPPIRDRMARIMRPDPELADFIARECAKDDWEGIIARIWPKTKFINVSITGSMAQYISTIDYYSGGLPIVSISYASSECFFGINLNPICNPHEVSYTIMPNIAYFEFFPHEPDSLRLAHSEPVDLVDVELGKEYELVITTYAGLYRYQVGDILKVTGFYNSAPQFRFVMRKNVLLGIDTDKTTEPQLQAAVDTASKLLLDFNTSVVEYTSYADTKTIPGHYVIYWELMKTEPTNSPSDELLDRCCLAMEESFDSEYRRCRVAEKAIGPLEIRVVKNGTFEELMDYAISRGVTMSQYKTPRCVSAKPMVDLLDSRVASKHFSPSLPHWTSEGRL